MLTLYYFPDTIAVATAIALEETGLGYDARRVDFTAAEQTKPDYHAVNPKGRVPALETPQGILTETGALLDYIAASAPEAGLVPHEPFRAAKVREAMYYIASTMHVNHAHKMRGHRWADQQDSWADMSAKVPETMTASAAYVEGNLLEGPFVLGDTFSMADPYLFIVCHWLEGDHVDLTPFPKIRAFLEAMESRPSLKAVREKGILL